MPLRRCISWPASANWASRALAPAIHSKGRTDRFYVFIPLPLAAAIGLEGGQEIQWSVRDRDTLIVQHIKPTIPSAVGQRAKKGKTPKQK
jgi:hypothetical protein